MFAFASLIIVAGFVGLNVADARERNARHRRRVASMFPAATAVTNLRTGTAHKPTRAGAISSHAAGRRSDNALRRRMGRVSRDWQEIRAMNGRILASRRGAGS